jgi:DNA polymerase III subunit delta
VARASQQGISREECERSIRKKSFSPVYLFYGEEDFLIDETVALILEHAIDESARSFNLDLCSGSDCDARQLAAMASAYPMMSDRRVIVLRDLDRLGAKENLVPYLLQPMASTVLVLITLKPDLRQKLYKTLQEHAVVVEFRQMYDNEIPDWIRRRIQSQGKTVTPEACQLLNSYLGRSLREIQQEIDKLFLYVGAKPGIDVEDVTAVVGVSRTHTIFELQRAIGRREIRPALSILENMLDSGENALGVLVMLTKYFQKLWAVQEILGSRISDFQLASAIGISPAFAGEYRSAAQQWTGEQIEGCFSVLTEADTLLKTGGPDARLVLTTMIYRFFGMDRVTRVV